MGSAELEKTIELQDDFNNLKLVDLICRCVEIGGKNVTVLAFSAKGGGHRTFEVSEKKQIAYFVEKDYIEIPPCKGTKKEPEWKENGHHLGNTNVCRWNLYR